MQPAKSAIVCRKKSHTSPDAVAILMVSKSTASSMSFSPSELMVNSQRLSARRNSCSASARNFAWIDRLVIVLPFGEVILQTYNTRYNKQMQYYFRKKFQLFLDVGER